MGRISKHKKKRALIAQYRKHITSRRKQSAFSSPGNVSPPPPPPPSASSSPSNVSPPPSSPPPSSAADDGFHSNYFYASFVPSSPASEDRNVSYNQPSTAPSVSAVPSTSHDRAADFVPPSSLRDQLFDNTDVENVKVCEEKLVVTVSQLNAIAESVRCPVQTCGQKVKINSTCNRFDTTIDVVCTGCPKIKFFGLFRVIFAAQVTILDHNFGFDRCNLLEHLFGSNMYIQKGLALQEKRRKLRAETPKMSKKKRKKLGKSAEYKTGEY